MLYSPPLTSMQIFYIYQWTIFTHLKQIEKIIHVYLTIIGIIGMARLSVINSIPTFRNEFFEFVIKN